MQEVVTIGVPLFCFQTCSFVKLARVSVTESDSLQLSNERQDIWYDVMNDKDVNNISRNFDFHRQHIIPCNAREIKNNFLDNLNCWLKQISSLTLPVPTHTRHTEDLGRSNKIFLELSEIQWNKFYGPWKENFTRNENLPTDPRITRTTLHYNVLNWSVSFISSSLCSNEFILPLGRELISFQINLSK